MSRSRLYSFINIAGLAIALTAALLIYSHVVKEFKTNRFHENREHIFRVTTSGIFSDQWSYSSCAPMGPYALSEIPEVQNYTRIARTKYLIQTDDSTDFIEPERTIQADARFFDIFTFPLVAGGIPKPDASHWCVITESQAEKLFGNTKPIGETIRVKHDTQITAKPHEYQVVAVMKDIPAWSTIQADIVLTMVP